MTVPPVRTLPRSCFLMLFFFLNLSAHAQESREYTSTGWGASTSHGATGSQRSGEVLPVEFVVKLKGKKVEGQERITLEGETRVQNSRLELYFKQKQRESQKTSYSYGNSATNGSGYPLAATRSRDANTAENAGSTTSSGNLGWGGDAAAGIVNAHFKLLQLQPMAGMGKVTAELYMGDNEHTPYLEAVEMRLNPFKKTPMELVMTTFEEVDLRSVRVVVHLDGPVKDEWEAQEFTADFRCYLQVGEASHSYYGSENGEETDVQWVQDPEE